MNAITKFHNQNMSIEALDRMVSASTPNVPQPTSGAKFLRLSADDGSWVFGADNTEVEAGSRWAVNPFSFRTGYVAWATAKLNGGRREKLGEVMGSVDNPPAMPDVDHSARGGEWQEQVGFDLICLDGEDQDLEVQYNNNSHGGKSAFGALFNEVGMRPSPEHCFPVVVLESDSYHNKNWGKTVFTPIFKVVDWADHDQNLLSGISSTAQLESPEAGKSDSLDTAPEDQPKRRQRRRVDA